MRFAGLDVHKSFIQVCILDRSSGLLEEFRIESNSEALRGVAETLSGVERVALEASSHWHWVVDELQGMGFEVKLSHPSKTKAIASAKIKTDKIDAKMLAYLLSVDLLPEAHVPGARVRELRSYLRYRYALVCMRTRCKNHIHAILAGYGLRPPVKDVFTKTGLAWLSGCKLRELHREEVDGYLGIMGELDARIGEIDKRITPLAEEDEAACLLKSLHGIGYYSALLMAVEIDGVERFRSAKHLVSYGGLCPSTRSSGGKEYHGRITKSGSKYLRWILLEAAQKATFRSSPMHSFYCRIAAKKGHGTAKTAVARKLLESAYYILKKGEAFDSKAWAN